jgi:hypothetical protein
LLLNPQDFEEELAKAEAERQKKQQQQQQQQQQQSQACSNPQQDPNQQQQGAAGGQGKEGDSEQMVSKPLPVHVPHCFKLVLITFPAQQQKMPLGSSLGQQLHALAAIQGQQLWLGYLACFQELAVSWTCSTPTHTANNRILPW